MKRFGLVYRRQRNHQYKINHAPTSFRDRKPEAYAPGTDGLIGLDLKISIKIEISTHFLVYVEQIQFSAFVQLSVC